LDLWRGIPPGRGEVRSHLSRLKNSRLLRQLLDALELGAHIRQLRPVVLLVERAQVKASVSRFIATRSRAALPASEPPSMCARTSFTMRARSSSRSFVAAVSPHPELAFEVHGRDGPLLACSVLLGVAAAHPVLRH